VNIGWNAPRGKKKTRYLNPVLAVDEMGRPCRRCHEDAGKCWCVAYCGVLVCTGAKETSDGD
jgi:hypothetical protein